MMVLTNDGPETKLKSVNFGWRKGREPRSKWVLSSVTKERGQEEKIDVNL